MEDTEQFYSNAIKIANEMQNEAEKTKVRIVAQTKQLVNECDRTFRSVGNVQNSVTFPISSLFIYFNVSFSFV